MPAFRPLWFRLAPADLDFALRAPHRFTTEALIYTTPEQVFEILAKPEAMNEWIVGYAGFRWTSPEPHGAGSTREIKLGVAGFRERFLAWEPGRRFCFTIEETTAP